jgi:hypothetical protein
MIVQKNKGTKLARSYRLYISEHPTAATETQFSGFPYEINESQIKSNIILLSRFMTKTVAVAKQAEG